MYAGCEAIVDIENRSIPGTHGPVPIRIYTPRATPRGPMPVFMFIHGGGSIMGSLDSFDWVCQQLCAQSECLVISVSYRQLQPDHRFRICPARRRALDERCAHLGSGTADLAVPQPAGSGLGVHRLHFLRPATRRNHNQRFCCRNRRSVLRERTVHARPRTRSIGAAVDRLAPGGRFPITPGLLPSA